jgi:dihydroxyacetone synthase
MARSLEEVEDTISAQPVKRTSEKTQVMKALETLKLQEDDKHEFVLKVYRCLIADLCEQYKGGHPGYARYSKR